MHCLIPIRLRCSCSHRLKLWNHHNGPVDYCFRKEGCRTSRGCILHKTTARRHPSSLQPWIQDPLPAFLLLRSFCLLCFQSMPSMDTENHSLPFPWRNTPESNNECFRRAWRQEYEHGPIAPASESAMPGHITQKPESLQVAHWGETSLNLRFLSSTSLPDPSHMPLTESFLTLPSTYEYGIHGLTLPFGLKVRVEKPTPQTGLSGSLTGGDFCCQRGSVSEMLAK